MTLMSLYSTTIIQCNHSISTIIIYLFNINVPLTEYISQYVRLTVHVNSTLHHINRSLHLQFTTKYLHMYCIYNMLYNNQTSNYLQYFTHRHTYTRAHTRWMSLPWNPRCPGGPGPPRPPADPGNPIGPGEPRKPAAPGEPLSPGAPGVPTGPDGPGCPVQPGKPIYTTTNKQCRCTQLPHPVSGGIAEFDQFSLVKFITIQPCASLISDPDSS